MRTALSIALGKTVKKLARIRGGGSALPGLVVEKTDPGFLARVLNQLPLGVIVISGTNGKTTTTKMVVQLLRSAGVKVFTNDTGSNFVRGVIAALLNHVDTAGRLDADIAVLELDEAHAVHFVQQVPPTHCLLLNVMRDQLDRFGEVDYTASLLTQIAEATTGTVVTNRHDSRLLALGERLAAVGRKVQYFGLSPQVAALFPDDDALRGTAAAAAQAQLPAAEVELAALDSSTQQATFRIAETSYQPELALSGLYNIYNAAAALALARHILPAGSDAELVTALAQVRPAFGRGETFTINGQPLQLVLVKNPAGFRLALASYPAAGWATMIAINDAYADGRDLSWLWDVDFDSLAATGVSVVSGVRAHEMALRLYYDQVAYEQLIPGLAPALEAFRTAHPGTPQRIYCTYTAMLQLRKLLKDYVDVETAIQ